MYERRHIREIRSNCEPNSGSNQNFDEIEKLESTKNEYNHKKKDVPTEQSTIKHF